MSYLRYALLFCSVVLVLGCEELIDVDLNAGDPKIVIVADLNTAAGTQEIRIARTVDFDEDRSDQPVEDAVVYLRAGDGKVYAFRQQGKGRYTHAQVPLKVGETYFLDVTVDDQHFTSQSALQSYVDIDSIGLTKENLFNEDYYFVNLKFLDPAGEPNYYRYTVSLNGEPFVFSSVMSDKFNDGKQVTHQIGAPEGSELRPGDELRIRRSTISKDVHRYWSEYQSTNPGSAAPGNPTSNISNGALGYFSVSNLREYTVTVEDTLE